MYSFVYSRLNVKTVLYQTIQFSVSTVLMSKTVPFQTNQFSINVGTQFNCQKHLYFKLFSLVKQFYFKQFSLALVYSLVLLNP